MTTIILEDPKVDTYNDIKNMLYKMAWNANKKYGKDWKEYESAANEGFMEAYNSYDPSKNTAFSTWVWWQARAKIQALAVGKKIDRMTVNPGEDIDLSIFQAKESFDLDSFQWDLSNDAKRVIKLLVDCPMELLDIIKTSDGPECIRCGLFCQLKEAGWTIARILESFIEVKEALS